MPTVDKLDYAQLEAEQELTPAFRGAGSHFRTGLCCMLGCCCPYGLLQLQI